MFLFEYGKWETVTEAEELKQLLEVIWQEKSLLIGESNYPETDLNLFQPFFQFDGNKIRAKNYSGFIQRGDDLIEIYPKVFREGNCQNKALMLDHIFYWLSYCRKWKFPFNQVGLKPQEIDNFPELIIYLITSQIHSIVSSQPLSQYQAVEEALLVPRGSLNINRYINNSLSRSNFHVFECDYDPFVFDNKVNRVIKYSARLLLQRTSLSENIRLLQEIIYILDEVVDLPCNVQTIDSIVLNSFYDEYIQVLNNCRLILSQQLYSSSPYDSSQWCLLLPMEYLFEDFLAGFLETHFGRRCKVEYQKSDLYLSTDPMAFRLQHDIFIKGETSLILDAKYKIRKADFKDDPKKGIAQADLYQMLSYAYKRGCDQVILVYPNILELCNEPDTFKIESGFDKNLTIKAKAVEIPFWSINGTAHLEEKLKYSLNNLLFE